MSRIQEPSVSDSADKPKRTESTPRDRAPAGARPGLRKDIQALRAIAVGLVLLNHLWPWHVPGGYVGVDVFFVISGFLITAHLNAELVRTGTISLPRFYARRAKRLLPAAILVAAVSLLASIAWLPIERWARIANEVFAASAYVLNWVLSGNAVNYSALSDVATPVQHYWSLSVEEQFYLLWPLILMLISMVYFRYLENRYTSQRVMALAIGVIGIASFSFAVWYTEAEKSAAYFNTFARVWEFLLGGLIAVLLPSLSTFWSHRSRLRFAEPMQGVLQLAGYSMILGSAMFFDAQTAFPGPWALLPAAGTVLVIASGPRTPRWSPAQMLEWRPVQFVGDTSYALYLWHWPLVVILPFVIGRQLGTVERVGILVASVMLAAATKYFIEDPGRVALFKESRPRVVLLSALASVIVIGGLTWSVSAIGGALQESERSRLAEFRTDSCYAAGALHDESCADPFGPAIFPVSADGEAPWDIERDSLCEDQSRKLLTSEMFQVTCDFSDNSTAGSGGPGLRVWLVGDSHAEHWQAAIYPIAKAHGWNFTYTAQGGCPSVVVPLQLSVVGENVSSQREKCLEWGTEMLAAIQAAQPDLVLVSNFTTSEIVDDGSGETQVQQLSNAMRDQYIPLIEAGTRFIIIRDVPVAGDRLGAECVVLHGSESRGCVAGEAEVNLPDAMVLAAERLANDRISSVDLSDQFCREGVCSGVIGGLPVYFDWNHVSSSYARSISHILEERIFVVLGGAKR